MTVSVEPTTRVQLIEDIARILEPLAWAALGSGDTRTYEARRISSVRKIERILPAIEARIVERCAKVARMQSRVGREWVPDSLWANICKRVETEIRSLSPLARKDENA